MRASILLVGEKASGKSSFCKRAVENTFSVGYLPTFFLEINSHPKLKLQIYDSGGGTNVDSAINSYLQSEDMHLIALLVNLSDIEKSLLSLKAYQSRIHTTTKCIVIYTKSDLVQSAPTEEELKKHAKTAYENAGVQTTQIDDKYYYYVTSAKNDTGMKDAVNGMAALIEKNTRIVYRSNSKNPSTYPTMSASSSPQSPLANFWGSLSNFSLLGFQNVAPVSISASYTFSEMNKILLAKSNTWKEALKAKNITNLHPIIVPDQLISTKYRNSLSTYLQKEKKENSGPRILAIPCDIDNQWVALMLYIRDDNTLASTCLISPSPSRFNKPSAPFPQELDKTHTICQQIKSAYPEFDRSVYIYQRYLNEKNSDVLVIENLGEMYQRIYFGYRHPLNPETCDTKKISDFRTEQKKLITNSNPISLNL